MRAASGFNELKHPQIAADDEDNHALVRLGCLVSIQCSQRASSRGTEAPTDRFLQMFWAFCFLSQGLRWAKESSRAQGVLLRTNPCPCQLKIQRTARYILPFFLHSGATPSCSSGFRWSIQWLLPFLCRTDQGQSLFPICDHRLLLFNFHQTCPSRPAQCQSLLRSIPRRQARK